METYKWLLKRKTQNKITVDIQDLASTNAKLKKAVYDHDLSALTPQEIGEILGVDAVIKTNYALSKPVSKGAAIALSLLIGLYVQTNTAKVNLSVFEINTGKMFWNYQNTAGGGYLNNPAQLVDYLMKNASKGMPYVQK